MMRYLSRYFCTILSLSFLNCEGSKRLSSVLSKAKHKWLFIKTLNSNYACSVCRRGRSQLCSSSFLTWALHSVLTFTILYLSLALQVRLPDGTSLTQTFRAREQLAAVRLYVELHRGEEPGGGQDPVQLLSGFPRRAFSEADMERPLQELGTTCGT